MYTRYTWESSGFPIHPSLVDSPLRPKCMVQWDLKCIVYMVEESSGLHVLYVLQGTVHGMRICYGFLRLQWT